MIKIEYSGYDEKDLFSKTRLLTQPQKGIKHGGQRPTVAHIFTDGSREPVNWELSLEMFFKYVINIMHPINRTIKMKKNIAKELFQDRETPDYVEIVK